MGSDDEQPEAAGPQRDQALKRYDRLASGLAAAFVLILLVYASWTYRGMEDACLRAAHLGTPEGDSYASGPQCQRIDFR